MLLVDDVDSADVVVVDDGVDVVVVKGGATHMHTSHGVACWRWTCDRGFDPRPVHFHVTY